MLYQAYQVQSDMMAPLRGFAGIALQGFGQMNPRLAQVPANVKLAAGYELLGRAGLTHERPPFGIDSVKLGRREVEVQELATDVTPFGTLLHFEKDTIPRNHACW